MFVIVAGAGLIGQEIARMLVRNKHDVVVIEIDRDICEELYAETGAMTIQGSATDIRVLQEAGADKADVILCAMRSDVDNMASAVLAKSLGVPRIIARLRNPHYEDAYKLAGVTTIVRMADLILNEIMMEIEQPPVRKIMVMGAGEAEIYAVHIPAGARSVGMAIKDIAQEEAFPRECLFMGIYDEERGNFKIPRGDQTLSEGDTVFLVSRAEHIKNATDFLTATE